MKSINARIHLGKLGRDSTVDWYVCLGLFVVALIGATVVDALFYRSLSVVSPAPSAVADAPSGASIDRGTIEDVAAKLRAKGSAAQAPSAAALKDPAGE